MECRSRFWGLFEDDGEERAWHRAGKATNAHSAMLVVALTRHGGQEKGKGHRSESKTGDPGGGEGAPSPKFQLGSLATPTHVLEARLLCGARLGHRGGGQMRKLWPSKDVGQGGPLRGCEDCCHSWGEEAGKSRGPLGAGLGG